MSIEEFWAILDGKSVEKTSRKKPVQHEHNLQKTCVEWFRWTYRDALIYAIPNGGYRGSTIVRNGHRTSDAEHYGKILQEEGTLAGIPDLHIPIPRNGYASLYIEMKNGSKGVLSAVQKDRIRQLRALGNRVEVVRDYDGFVQVVTDYLGSPKDFSFKSV